jgi:hypothetical protein
MQRDANEETTLILEKRDRKGQEKKQRTKTGNLQKFGSITCSEEEKERGISPNFIS